jgi:hypothetical protein
MSHERLLDYLNRRRIIYRRLPILDKPTACFKWGYFYENGTHECYDLFRSKAKITSYKSLKWHLLVLWYLNPQLDQKDFNNLAEYICNKKNGFITFEPSDDTISKIVRDVSIQDLEQPPKNKTRKIIFKYECKLSLSEKLSIVGQMIGKTKRVTPEDIYDMMLYINENNEKITITKLAKLLNCTTRTIHRNITNELKNEKELLNQQNEKVQHSQLCEV